MTVEESREVTREEREMEGVRKGEDEPRRVLNLETELVFEKKSTHLRFPLLLRLRQVTVLIPRPQTSKLCVQTGGSLQAE